MPLSPGGSTVTAGGASLEYRWWGPGPGGSPTIVMLHEGLGSVGLWRDMPERLAGRTGLGVMAYSRAGYGASDAAPLPRPLDYMTREALDVLPALLDGLGIACPILLGHSDGATIAAIYAGSADVRAAILIAPHFFAEPEGLVEIAHAREAFETGDLRARLARHHADPDCAFRGWNDAWLAPGFRDWDVTDVIQKISAPILAVQGSDDRYGTLAQIDVIERLANATVDTKILPGCGHAPHLEAPDELVSVISQFVGRLGAPI